MQETADSEIDAAFNQGAILRTHIMRPTWHFVTPGDIRWIQALTAPHVHKKNGPRYRQLDLDNETFSRSHKILCRILEGKNYLTRAEIGSALEAQGIMAQGQRLAYIVMQAELEGLICSGPRRGKQFTYALMDERAPQVIQPDNDQALARLARIYFAGHGPAQVKDFAWWSGLTMKEAQAGLEMIKAELVEYALDGLSCWSGELAEFEPSASAVQPRAYLISVYDEYFIGYSDRSALLTEEDAQQMGAVGNAQLASLIIINGRVAGTWKRMLKKNDVQIQLFPFRALNKNEQRLVEQEAERFGRFLQKEVVF